MKTFFSFILLLPFLFGCVSTSQTGVPQPTQSSEPIEITVPLPTHTIVAVATHQQPVALIDSIIGTAQAVKPSCDSQPYSYIDLSYDYSPDKRWLILNCEGENHVAFVVDLKQSRFWKINSYEYLSQNTHEIRMNGRYWTQDGNYVYLEPHFCCADGPSFYNAWGLIELDLQTGEYKTVLQPSFSDTVYSFAISHDDKFLVYVSSHQNQTVHVLDLKNGHDKTINFKNEYTDIGDFVWTPDNSEILIVAGLEGWRDQKGGYSIFLYDLGQDSVHVLVDADMRQPAPPVVDYEYNRKSLWLTDETIILYSLDGQFVLNIRTGEMTPIDKLPPTP